MSEQKEPYNGEPPKLEVIQGGKTLEPEKQPEPEQPIQTRIGNGWLEMRINLDVLSEAVERMDQFIGVMERIKAVSMNYMVAKQAQRVSLVKTTDGPPRGFRGFFSENGRH